MKPPDSLMITICVEIGNSDDQLSQQLWATFCADTAGEIEDAAVQVFGVRYSGADSPYQNACWHFSARLIDCDAIMEGLRSVAYNYGQDSIAWSVIAETEFIKPPERA